MPQDLSKVDFYLWTFDVGSQIQEKWGHNAIRMVDNTTKVDLIFNMGTYDQFEPDFMFKFVKGILIYRLGINTYGATLRQYNMRQRGIIQEKINLTNLQKHRLAKRLVWQAQPENVHYEYQYWRSNCSSKLRDFLDEALGGGIKAHTTRIIENRRFRDYTRWNIEDMPWIASTLDMSLNSNVDYEISIWEDMFLPSNMRKHLLALDSLDDNGNPIDGRPLLSETTAILTFNKLPLSKWHGWYRGYQSVFLAFLLAIATGAYLSYRRSSQLGSRILGLTYVFWGLFAGILSTLWFVAWTWSHHTDLHHNANLLLILPIDLFYILFGIQCSLRGEIPSSGRLFKINLWLLLTHTVCFTALASLFALGIIKQDVGYPLLYLAPVIAALGLLPILLKRRLQN